MRELKRQSKLFIFVLQLELKNDFQKHYKPQLNMFKLKYWILFLRFLIADGQTYFATHPIYDAVECNPITTLIVEINFQYYKDQHFMTLIDLSPIQTANVFKCLDKFRPVDVFNDLNQINLGAALDTSSVSSYPITHGFCIKGSLTEMRFLIKLIAAYNPLTKLLIILMDESVEIAKQILREAFHDHKILNTGIMRVNDVYENRRYVTTTVSFMMYNPFSGDRVNRKPEFVDFAFTSTNSLQQFDAMKSFMEKRTRNLHGFPFRVNIFELHMVSAAHRDQNGKITNFSYVDGDTLSTIADLMNFTPIYERTHDDKDKYGFQFPNGTFSGGLADVEYGYVEIAANPKIISTSYNTSKSVFLQPITMVRLSFIIRRRETYKMLLVAIFNQYDTPSRVIVVCLYCLFPLLCVTIRRLELKIFNPQQRVTSISNTILYTLAIMSNISMKQPKHSGLRILVASILFYALVVSSLFQSTIIKNLNTKLVGGKITTIDQLMDEGYLIKMPAHIALIFKKQGFDKVTSMMKKSKQTYLDVAVPSADIENLLQPGKKIAYLCTNLYYSSFHFRLPMISYFILLDTSTTFWIDFMTRKRESIISRTSQR